MINIFKRRGSFLVISFATLLLLGMSTMNTFAATSAEQPKHDMGNMTQDSMSGHDMNSMMHESQGSHNMGTMSPNDHNGHDMNSMTSDSQNSLDMNNMNHDGHGKKEAENDNPWPVLYGFGGAISAVILVAGIMKYTKLKGQGV
ncbi:MAG: hypothetical protein E6713_09570 [Sporomusaceae bacterium]|nr:hypothetical protein [Sporomusaceae bacterium]